MSISNPLISTSYALAVPCLTILNGNALECRIEPRSGVVSAFWKTIRAGSVVFTIPFGSVCGVGGGAVQIRSRLK